MKKRKIMQTLMPAVLTTVCLVTAGCGQKDSGIVTNRQTEAAENSTQEAKTAEDIQEAQTEESTLADSQAVSEDEAEVVDFNTKVVEDTFEQAVSYINKNGIKKLSIDYGTVQFEPGKRTNRDVAGSVAEMVDSKLAAYSMKRIRMYRNDANGSTIDFTVYTNPGSKQIDKIVSTEYCSDGRDITNFYFEDGMLNYVYAYKNDIYGTGCEDGTLPGKKCYFANDSMVECYVDDEDAFDSNSSYLSKDYSQYDEFIQSAYDEMERDFVNRAYITYAAVRDIPSTAVISGYVADEYGGILSNVKMEISSKAHSYSEKFVTNGDGYFEVMVPVNNDDWYGVEMTYGDFVPVTIDDINITPGTTEYSLGITYMAAKGENKHDTAYYLLDATKKSKSSLKENEYQVVLTFDNAKADLVPFSMNLKKGKSDNSMSTIISTDDNSQFKYYVTDRRGGNSDNTMTYEMSTSEARVQVFGKDGLVASYQVPVNRAGVVWEVFEVDGNKIIPVNNYYYAVGKETFFER